MLASEIKAHVENRILETPVTENPVAHVYVENVFPPEFYAQLLKSLPANEDYTAYKPPYQERSFINLSPTGVGKINSSREFWRDMAEWIVSDSFVDLSIRKFQPWVADTYPFREEMIRKARNANGSVSVTPRALLARDFGAFHVGPHTDAADKIVTYIFYLPKAEDMVEFGTTFYRPKDPSYRNWKSVHHSFDDFEEAQLSPYKPNSLVGFVKTDRSFHGVADRAYPNKGRDIILFAPEIGQRPDVPAVCSISQSLFGVPNYSLA
jgi:hypothetical protein